MLAEDVLVDTTESEEGPKGILPAVRGMFNASSELHTRGQSPLTTGSSSSATPFDWDPRLSAEGSYGPGTRQLDPLFEGPEDSDSSSEGTGDSLGVTGSLHGHSTTLPPVAIRTAPVNLSALNLLAQPLRYAISEAGLHQSLLTASTQPEPRVSQDLYPLLTSFDSGRSGASAVTQADELFIGQEKAEWGYSSHARRPSYAQAMRPCRPCQSCQLRQTSPSPPSPTPSSPTASSLSDEGPLYTLSFPPFNNTSQHGCDQIEPRGPASPASQQQRQQQQQQGASFPWDHLWLSSLPSATDEEPAPAQHATKAAQAQTIVPQVGPPTRQLLTSLCYASSNGELHIT